jgi:ligand-binding sensor domain-containing protein
MWRWVQRGSWLLLVAALTARAQHYPVLPVPDSPHGILAMMQDSHSALWLGTIDDVYRFDGEHFYSLRQYGFPRERVTSLAEDSNGGIWITTQVGHPQSDLAGGGIYRYQNGKVDRVFSAAAVSVVRVGPDTMLATIVHRLEWDYGDLYIFRRNSNGWQPARLMEGYARYLSVDHKGTVLFPCRPGTCELSAEQIRNATAAAPQPRVEHGNSDVMRDIRDRFGCLWTRSTVVMGYQCPGSPAHLIADAVVGSSDSANLAESADGSVLSIGSGLVLSRSGATRYAGAANGLPGEINVAIPARDGTIFLGANSGLYRFMYPFRLEYWDQEDGVDSPYSILSVKGRVFSSNSGIKVLDANRTRWEPWVSPAQVGTAVHLIPGPSDSIYAASLIRGVTQISPDGKVLAHSTYGPGGARLAQDQHGHTWLAGTGVTLVTRKGSTLELTPQGIPDGTSLDLEYDPKRDALWACHEREVIRLQSNRWAHVTHHDGLLDDGCRSITVLADGDVWVAYDSLASLSRIQTSLGGAFHVDNYEYPNSTQNTDGTFLDVDSRGWLWRASAGSDFIATPDAAARRDWLRLNTQDGIPVPGGNQNSFYNDPDGSIWFASSNTVVHFTPPDDFATHFPVPAIFIAGFSYAQNIPLLADAIGIIPSATRVVAHVGSLQFERRNALHLRYRLLPEQSDWIETSSFDLALGKLRWGHQTLQVQGQLETGPWSPIVEQPLTVPWPIWLTWPMLLFYGAGGTGLGFGAAQWKKRRRFQHELTLPDLSAWRMRARSPETEHLIGTCVDKRYEIGHILSVGGFATVVRARDLQRDGQLCAVKIFRYEFGDRAWIRHRFEQEISALEQLSHPNIVRITGHGATDTGAPYLVMDFIHGQSLRERLNQGALSRRLIGTLLRQIADALQSLHRKAIYHRDLKPENLMIRSDADGQPQIVLIDFSIAIVKSRDKTFHGISRVAGTLEYMAPEQVIGYADASTDIYALAKVVMEMITGLRWMELFPEATLDLPEQIRAYFAKNPGVLDADSVDRIVSALAFDPARRPQDIIEFAKPISRHLEENP